MLAIDSPTEIMNPRIWRQIQITADVKNYSPDIRFNAPAQTPAQIPGALVQYPAGCVFLRIPQDDIANDPHCRLHLWFEMPMHIPQVEQGFRICADRHFH
jgi:hypothetical protein